MASVKEVVKTTIQEDGDLRNSTRRRDNSSRLCLRAPGRRGAASCSRRTRGHPMRSDMTKTGRYLLHTSSPTEGSQHLVRQPLTAARRCRKTYQAAMTMLRKDPAMSPVPIWRPQPRYSPADPFLHLGHGRDNLFLSNTVRVHRKLRHSAFSRSPRVREAIAMFAICRAIQ